MNKKFVKSIINKTAILSLIFSMSMVSIAGSGYISAVHAEEASEVNSAVAVEQPFVYSPQTAPWAYGEPFVIPSDWLNIEGETLKGFKDSIPQNISNSNNPYVALGSIAFNHNTPIILDLSNENITTIDNGAFFLANIHVLKLPSTLQVIGSKAFANTPLAQIYFKGDPENTLSVYDDSFQLARATTKRTSISGENQPDTLYSNTIEIDQGADRPPVSIPFGTFFELYEGSNENPFFIDINGTKSYATVSSLQPNLIVPTATGDINFGLSTINVDATAVTDFSASTALVNPFKPLEYGLRIPAKQVLKLEASESSVLPNTPSIMSGSVITPFNRVIYIDATPIAALGKNDNGDFIRQLFPKFSASVMETNSIDKAIVGQSTGHLSNYSPRELKNLGYKIVRLKELYPEMPETKVREEIQANFLLNNYIPTENGNIGLYAPPQSYTFESLRKKFADIAFVAKPAKIFLQYKDVKTGKIINTQEVRSFIGQFLYSDIKIPEGYKLFGDLDGSIQITDNLQVGEVLVEEGVSGEATSFIDFVNESGFRIGTSIPTTGKEGDRINLLKDKSLQDFIKKYNIKLLDDPANFKGSFINNKHYLLTTKGKAVGPAGRDGIDGKNGVDGKDAPYRVAGKDRIATSIELSGENFESAENVFLASGRLYPDALTGGVAASLYNAPILLTENPLERNVIKEIKRLDAKNIYIIGGKNTLSLKYEEMIHKYLPGKKVIRIGGSDRYETSVKISELIKHKNPNFKSSVIASGENYPDALTSSMLAVKNKIPVLLTKKNILPAVVKDSLVSNAINEVYIAGGLNSVADLDYGAVKTSRIAGKDRYETAALFAKKAYPNAKIAFLASGEEFADALATIPVCNVNEIPVLLTQKYRAPKVVADYVKNNKLQYVVIVGGKNTISGKIYYDLFIKTKLSKNY